MKCKRSITGWHFLSSSDHDAGMRRNLRQFHLSPNIELDFGLYRLGRIWTDGRREFKMNIVTIFLVTWSCNFLRRVASLNGSRIQFLKNEEWWRQWVDLNLMIDLAIFIRPHALGIIFIVRNDEIWMRHTDQKRDYKSFSNLHWNPEDWINMFLSVMGHHFKMHDHLVAPIFF